MTKAQEDGAAALFIFLGTSLTVILLCLGFSSDQRSPFICPYLHAASDFIVAFLVLPLALWFVRDLFLDDPSAREREARSQILLENQHVLTPEEEGPD